MVNSVDFINRLKKVMEFHGLTASNFSDTIGVQRSSISHILSGRNKPSLDFVLKVTNKFTDVDIYWLLNGKGAFPKQEEASTPTSSISMNVVSEIQKSTSTTNKEIQRIVVFYKNGTFEEYLK